MFKIPICPLDRQIHFSIHKIELNNIGSRKIVKRADDKFLIINCFGSKRRLLLYGLISICLISFGLYMSYYSMLIERGISIFFSWVVPFVVTFAFASRSKVFIFNRMKGTLTVTRVVQRKEKGITKRFDYIGFAREGFDKFEKVDNLEKTFCLIVTNIEERDALIRDMDPMEWHSLFVWYMDKNRPLPLGTAFDLYRELDYERRKSEGFPLPLYDSLVETQEWVGAENDDKRKKYRAYLIMLRNKYRYKNKAYSK